MGVIGSSIPGVQSRGWKPTVAPVSPALNIRTLALAESWPGIIELPETYGARRDGVTDDSEAVTMAIEKAISRCISAGTYCCEVWFTPGVYAAKRACIKTATNMGNAQIPIPYIKEGEKVTITLRGVPGFTADYYFAGAARPGAVIETHLTGQVMDGTYGPPSIIGTPTREALGDGVFSRTCVIVDGLSLIAPADPTIWGLDVMGSAECDIKALMCQANSVTMPEKGESTFATALRMPGPGNSNNCELGSLTAVGWYNGLQPGEHTNARRVRIIDCRVGVALGDHGGFPYGHFANIEYLTTESVKYHLYCSPASKTVGRWMGMNITTWDIEDNAEFATTDHIDDPGNEMQGKVNYWRVNSQGIEFKKVGGEHFTATEL